MNIYYTFYAVYFSLAYLSILNTRSAVNKLSIILVFALIALASFRYGVGTDFYTYLALWDNAYPLHEGMDYGYKHYEVGFRYLTSFVKMFTENSFWYFFALSFISMYVFYLGIKKYDVNKSLAIFMYLCVFYLSYVFNGMGQAIAMSIFVFSLKYFLEGKLTQVLIATILAALLHKTGILILLAYVGYAFFRKIKIDYLVYIGVPLMFILSAANLAFILFSKLLPDMVYVYTEVFSEKTSAFQILTRFMVFFVLFFLYKKNMKNEFYKSVFLIYLFGFLLYILFMDFNMLATRINMFFRVTEILLFSNIVLCSSIVKRHFIFSVVAVVYSYSYFVVIQHPDFLYNTVSKAN